VRALALGERPFDRPLERVPAEAAEARFTLEALALFRHLPVDEFVDTD
jgi:hypothetical protein